MNCNKIVFVLAHNIRSLHNVGAIFRTSDGAGVSKLYLTGYSGVPPRQEIAKTALGAEVALPWEYHPDPVELMKELQAQGVQLLALEITQDSRSIFEFEPTYPCCLVIGNEVEGVEPELLELCDAVLYIPMRGVKNSLNVSVAFGVGIYKLTNNNL